MTDVLPERMRDPTGDCSAGFAVERGDVRSTDPGPEAGATGGATGIAAGIATGITNGGGVSVGAPASVPDAAPAAPPAAAGVGPCDSPPGRAARTPARDVPPTRSTTPAGDATPADDGASAPVALLAPDAAQAPDAAKAADVLARQDVPGPRNGDDAGTTSGSGAGRSTGCGTGTDPGAGLVTGLGTDPQADGAAGAAGQAPADPTLLEAFDRLMPFHVLVGTDGRIERCGPTLDRLAGPGRLQGRAFLQVFDLRRPREAFCFQALRRAGGSPLRLVLRDGLHPPMRGLMMPLPDGRTLVNLSFGIALVEAVGRYRLTADDFAATDLAVEMLFLVEAQSAALHESRKLNGRLQGAKIAAEEQAFTDTLTGLKNRRAMTQVMERLVGAGGPFAVLLLDLDFFKDVNDTLGHAAGDQVLQTVANILMDEARPGDTVVRLGGDEFALIAPGLSEAATALSLARHIVQRIEMPILVGPERCRVSASIGIALSSGGSDEGIADVLTRADAMLYAVKGAGRGDAAVAPPAAVGPAGTLPAAGGPAAPQDDAGRRSA